MSKRKRLTTLGWGNFLKRSFSNSLTEFLRLNLSNSSRTSSNVVGEIYEYIQSVYLKVMDILRKKGVSL